MELQCWGRIVALGPALDDARVLLRGPDYPAVGGPADGHLWFTESFAHRLSRAPILPPAPSARRDRHPQHARLPSRLAPRPQRCFWLSLFAVRTHLVEFVFRKMISATR